MVKDLTIPRRGCKAAGAMAMGTSLLVFVQWHGYRAIAIDALLILLEAQFAIGAFLWWLGIGTSVFVHWGVCASCG